MNTLLVFYRFKYADVMATLDSLSEIFVKLIFVWQTIQEIVQTLLLVLQGGLYPNVASNQYNVINTAKGTHTILITHKSNKEMH